VDGEMLTEPDEVVVNGGVRDTLVDTLYVTGAVKLWVVLQEWVLERVGDMEELNVSEGLREYVKVPVCVGGVNEAVVRVRV